MFSFGGELLASLTLNTTITSPQDPPPPPVDAHYQRGAPRERLNASVNMSLLYHSLSLYLSPSLVSPAVHSDTEVIKQSEFRFYFGFRSSVRSPRVGTAQPGFPEPHLCDPPPVPGPSERGTPGRSPRTVRLHRMRLCVPLREEGVME